MDDGLILAGSCAGLAALMGNRTALALLCSLGASFLMTDSIGLFLLDVAVLCVILRPNMTLADELIAALFVVAWAAYFADDQFRYDVGYAVVVLQMMLTIPARALAEEITIAREFVEDVASFVRSRLHRAIFRQSIG